MKVLLVSTYDHGGAAKACIRLHKGLLGKGIDSSLLFLKRRTHEVIPHSAVFLPPSVKRSIFQRIINKLRINSRKDIYVQIKKEIKLFIPEQIEYFSFADSGLDITQHPLYIEADVVNLHWVADFIDFSLFKKNKKTVIWTIHDMNPFTGGCHYAGDCVRFLSGCKSCPQLSVTGTPAFSDNVFRYKRKYLKHTSGLTVVSPSRWLKDVSMRSVLLHSYRHYCIPNGKDPLTFRMHDKSEVRKELKLPLDKKIILFVSDSLRTKRKGYGILQEVIQRMDREDVILCSVGGRQKESGLNARIIEFGHIANDEMMSMMYAAADLFIIPSMEDNLPNTVIESLLCGTPVVGFNTGGIPDMIEHGVNGYITESVNTDALLVVLLKAIMNLSSFDAQKIREHAMARYDISVIAELYITLYKKVMMEK